MGFAQESPWSLQIPPPPPRRPSRRHALRKRRLAAGAAAAACARLTEHADSQLRDRVEQQHAGAEAAEREQQRKARRILKWQQQLRSGKAAWVSQSPASPAAVEPLRKQKRSKPRRQPVPLRQWWKNPQGCDPPPSAVVRDGVTRLPKQSAPDWTRTARLPTPRRESPASPFLHGRPPPAELDRGLTSPFSGSLVETRPAAAPSPGVLRTPCVDDTVHRSCAPGGQHADPPGRAPSVTASDLTSAPSQQSLRSRRSIRSMETATTRSPNFHMGFLSGMLRKAKLGFTAASVPVAFVAMPAALSRKLGSSEMLARGVVAELERESWTAVFNAEVALRWDYYLSELMMHRRKSCQDAEAAAARVLQDAINEYNICVCRDLMQQQVAAEDAGRRRVSVQESHGFKEISARAGVGKRNAKAVSHANQRAANAAAVAEKHRAPQTAQRQLVCCETEGRVDVQEQEVRNWDRVSLHTAGVASCLSVARAALSELLLRTAGAWREADLVDWEEGARGRLEAETASLLVFLQTLAATRLGGLRREGAQRLYVGMAEPFLRTVCEVAGGERERRSGVLVRQFAARLRLMVLSLHSEFAAAARAVRKDEALQRSRLTAALVRPVLDAEAAAVRRSCDAVVERESAHRGLQVGFERTDRCVLLCREGVKYLGAFAACYHRALAAARAAASVALASLTQRYLAAALGSLREAEAAARRGVGRRWQRSLCGLLHARSRSLTVTDLWLCGAEVRLAVAAAEADCRDAIVRMPLVCADEERGRRRWRNRLLSRLFQRAAVHSRGAISAAAMDFFSLLRAMHLLDLVAGTDRANLASLQAARRSRMRRGCLDAGEVIRRRALRWQRESELEWLRPSCTRGHMEATELGRRNRMVAVQRSEQRLLSRQFARVGLSITCVEEERGRSRLWAEFCSCLYGVTGTRGFMVEVLRDRKKITVLERVARRLLMAKTARKLGCVLATAALSPRRGAPRSRRRWWLAFAHVTNSPISPQAKTRRQYLSA
eukprot:TRINITY_DN14972_c0_g1_i1.p1 TRINITY_DN14972_c0_g1~~TRINITY_DN14972_c0_g1_i1.p1  ORF type:complete len:1005 (+),score=290.17 TRINITY_DN14972_c0_g1_i1:59-3073(+)